VKQVLKLIGKPSPPNVSESLRVSGRILLPTKLGGLGFSRYSRVRHAAFISAVATSAPSIDPDITNVSDNIQTTFLHSIPGFTSSLTYINTYCSSDIGVQLGLPSGDSLLHDITNLIGSTNAKMQPTLTNYLNKVAAETIIQQEPDEAMRAIHRSHMGRESALALGFTYSRSASLSSVVFDNTLLIRMGYPIITNRSSDNLCTLCNLPCGSTAAHVLVCTSRTFSGPYPTSFSGATGIFQISSSYETTNSYNSSWCT
jgi:hypothetical protein